MAMATEINWRPHSMVSCLHAAEAISRQQPLADEQLAAAIEQPALQLARKSGRRCCREPFLGPSDSAGRQSFWPATTG